MGDAATITLRDKAGNAYDVSADQLPGALAKGWTVESDAAKVDRLAEDVRKETYGGLAGGVVSGGLAVARGASVGLSDVAFRGIAGDQAEQALSGYRNENPGISTAGNIVGAALPAFFSGGATAEASAGEIGAEALGARSLLAATPAGQVARLGSKIAGLGEGAGVVGRTAATAAAGATEGAIQNAGGYISDVALGDRKLSADGFIGAMGEGALWGGVAGGALSLSSEGLMAARRLFPAAEMTGEGAKVARQAASQEIQSAVEDTTQLTRKAESQLSEMRAQEEIRNPGFKQKMEEIRLKAAQDVADARVAAEQARTEAAQGKASIVTSKAKAAELQAQSVEARIAKKAAAKQTKPALDFLKGFETPVETAAETAAPAAAADTTSLLERQLAGTKALVDQGKTITEIGAMRPKVIGLEDAMNAELAKVNPEAAKIHEALVSAKQSTDEMGGWLEKYGDQSAVKKFERSQATRDYAEGMRPKEAGFYTKVPEGEGSIGLPRGRTSEFRGSEADRAAWEREFEAGNTPYKYGKLSSDEVMHAESAIDDITLRRMGRKGVRSPVEGPPSGDEILAGSEPVSAKVEKALASKPTDFNDDIAKTAPMITRHEAAHADLADVLGPNTPPSSQARSAAFRDAQRGAEQKASEQLQLTKEVIDKAPPTSLGKQMLGKAGDVAALYEALHSMGVPLPDPGNLPVIGPVLKLYMRAKLLGKAFGRHGGQVGVTAETAIASKAAAMRQRIYGAIDAGLNGASKVTGIAAKQGGGVAAALGHTLFDTKGAQVQPAPYSSEPAKGSLGELYVARSAEVEASQRPGAIADAIKQRVRTTDPETVAEIIATKERQLAYIAKEMPRPSAAPGVLDSRIWIPAKADLTEWAKCIAAVDDPGSVMERAAVGKATAKEIEAVKTVYPALYADGQQRVMKQIADGNVGKLSTTQRAQLSRTWGIPLDSVSLPEHTAWMQQSYQASPPAPQPTSQMGTPTLAGPMTIGQRTLTRFDGG